MMISPQNYYESELKGKSAEQITTAIRGLKSEIKRLKNIRESPDYYKSDEINIKPDIFTRISCYREYLDAAKAALSETGGVYQPSIAEIMAEKFDKNIPSINKIVFSIGGFFQGHETRTFTFDDQIHVNIEHTLPMYSDQKVLDMSNEEFFEELRELHIGEWRHKYTNYKVLDGTSWDLEIYFSGGHEPVKIHGSNAYPYNFKALTELLGVEDF